ARESMVAALGPIDVAGDPVPFTFTDYYREVMGDSLLRVLWAFERLADPGCLADWKLEAQRIEADIAARLARGAVSRPANLDPGYLVRDRLVLASTKDREQRIYLSKGIYAEVTLIRRRGEWTPLPWTFPDFASGVYDRFLDAALARYKAQLRAAGGERMRGG
ncbi:MAG: DUF4416 family protein, partial [Planctomycetota bacterium]|nr:DUF4416 family protein [Planctomycetota bacterium]